MTADDIITTARFALGVPFVHQGRSLRGLDCAGLLCFVAENLSVKYTDVSGYGRQPSDGLLEATFDAHVERGVLIRVALAEMQAGDFLMMRFRREPQHLGIFTGENLIHAYLQAGKVCEHRLDAKWQARIVRVYRLAGVEA